MRRVFRLAFTFEHVMYGSSLVDWPQRTMHSEKMVSVRATPRN